MLKERLLQVREWGAGPLSEELPATTLDSSAVVTLPPIVALKLMDRRQSVAERKRMAPGQYTIKLHAANPPDTAFWVSVPTKNRNCCTLSIRAPGGLNKPVPNVSAGRCKTAQPTLLEEEGSSHNGYGDAKDSASLTCCGFFGGERHCVRVAAEGIAEPQTRYRP
jgi:hypothetical protein